MSTEQNKSTAKRFFFFYLNKGSFAVMDELTSANYFNRLTPPGAPKGKEGEKILYGMYKNAFPDFHMDVNEVIGEGNHVAVSFTFTGTHTGDFAGIPPSGKKVTQRGIGWFKLENGQIVENEPGFDTLGILQQIGAFPK